MFAQLLKHEWKSSRKVLRVLIFSTLAAGILGAMVLRFLITEETLHTYASQNEWMIVLLPIMLTFLMFGLMGCAFGSEIYLLYRFYKSKFTDEGYLTFTLPVSSRQIFLASFFNIAFWTLIMVVVVFFAVVILFAGGLSGAGVDFAEELRVSGFSFPQLQGEELTYLVLSIFSGILSFVASIVLIMTCVTVGSVFAKKHKVFAAVGLYYGYSLIYSVVSTMIMVSSMAGSMDAQSLILLQMGVQSIVAVGGFFLSTYLMEKKLNLP